MTGLDGIDVVVLAGGLGTRIRGVLGDVPKVLAPINGRPFLDSLLEQLAAAGAGRAVLALGVGAAQVVAHLERAVPPLPVLAVIEPEPLGTAGALRHCLAHLVGDPVMVVNGDTWIEGDFGAFLDGHRRSGALASLLCVPVDDVARYGRVELAGDGRVTRFAEKEPGAHGPGLIHGGVCLLSAPALALLAAGCGPSFERDVLATLPAGGLYGWPAAAATFIDIGTPDTLAGAAAVVPQKKSAP
jgi:mannose-1-phosphate guanylyltransferase